MTDRGPVRSGDFVIGARIGGPDAPLADRPEKIWWAPLHNSMEMELLVRGRRLGGGEELAFESSLVGVPAGGDLSYASEEEVDAWFFPTYPVFPLAGEWVVVATSGANWGCFVITAKEARP